MPQILNDNRYDREELELLQQRARRRWLQSDWLAANRPRDYGRIDEDFPSSEVWIDLSGGFGESQQEPGAIVFGTVENWRGPTPNGESRTSDIEWSFKSTYDIPCESHTVDRIFVQEGTLHQADAWGVQKACREFARVLKVGGTVTVRDPREFLRTVESSLGRLGFTTSQFSTQRLDQDGELVMELSKAQSSLDDMADPLIRPKEGGLYPVDPPRPRVLTR